MSILSNKHRINVLVRSFYCDLGKWGDLLGSSTDSSYSRFLSEFSFKSLAIESRIDRRLVAVGDLSK